MKIIYLPQQEIDVFYSLLSDKKCEYFYNAQLKFIELISQYDNEELKLELRKSFNELMHKRFTESYDQLNNLLKYLKLHREGWISIFNSKKYHYCINGQTVCNKFLYLGNDYQAPTNLLFTKNDCSKCIKYIVKKRKSDQTKKVIN